MNFEKGFTVITGPNGSGKSNIADAILFALGENSPKQLRAANGRLVGLIYDPRKEEGSAVAPSERLKECRVTLQFDNSDRAIPIDSDLVTITRELRDSGENVYFLNGRKTTRSALSEIIDLAGLAPGGLNVVPQGAATKVADFAPDEKRRMIEDVVGIAKFDEKKAEAQRQLSQADQRLEVALARIGEMKSTLDSLDLQRNDLTRFNLLETQINWLRAVQTSRRIMELRERTSSLRVTEREQQSRLEELGARRRDFENRISQVESDRTRFIVDVVQGGGSGHVDLQFQLAQVDNELTTMEADLQDTLANIASLETEQIPSLKQIVGTKEKEVSASRATVSQLSTELARLDARRTEFLETFQDFQEAEEALRDTMDRKTKQLGRVQVKLADLAEKLNTSELGINAVNANLSSEKKRLDELKLRVDSYSAVLGGLEANTKKLLELYEGSTNELNSIETSLSGVERGRFKLLDSIEYASSILEKASSEVSKEEAYREVSESVAGERTGQARLQEFCESGGVNNYVGRVHQLISYSQAYSRAVTAVLGRWMSSFVVKDLRSMTALIKAAKSLKSSAYSVIPLEEVEESATVSARRSAGIIGPLSDVVNCEQKYRGMVNFLAGDTVLVETQAMGYIVASEGVCAVTVEGELFEPGGLAFSFGYQDVIMNILEGLENIEGLSDIEEAVFSLKKAIARRKTELESFGVNSRSLMKERVKKIASVASLKAEVDTITRMSNRYKTIFRSLSSESEKQGRQVDRLNRKLAANMERRDSLQRAINSLRELMQNTQSLHLDDMLHEVESTRKDVASQVDEVRNRIAEVNLNFTRERANLENVLTRTLEENQLDLESALEDFKSAKEFARDAPKRIRELSDSKKALQSQIDKLRESSRRSQPVLDEFESKIKRLKEERDAISRSHSSAERDLYSLRSTVDSTEEKVEEALSSLQMLGFTEALEVFDMSDFVLSELEKEYESVVSAVNRSADRQYRDMYQNYKSLSVRHNELEKERNSIISFIESVEAEKKTVFITAFKRIGEEFRGIFRRLASGEAWLELENPEDIFSGGVYLWARFGTKPAWESLSLSGGEKSVSGVALLLAMQSVQSHPFYLFDEIDMNLDAVNSDNLAQFLKERSRTAQIVGITLRDVIVAQSDMAYGVYAAGGVTRLVHFKPAAEVPAASG
jgi:chromosome segregation protein